MKISKDLSSKILTIGPDYHNHRGGVGAVLQVYSQYFEVFNFIPSYKVGSPFYKCYVYFLSLIKLVYTLVSNRKIKIIHIHGASYGSFYRKYVVFAIGKYIFRKKIIYYIHGGGFQEFYNKSNSFSKHLIRTLLANADVIICLSNSWHEYYSKNFKTKKLLILHNIIDYPIEIKYSGNPGILTFLFLGLISEAKGIFDLIEVIVKNKDRFRGRIKLLIGGNGEVKLLKDLIKKYHIEDIIEFIGWISGKEKTEVLNNSDVFILPSYHEGLPISILESMSYGKVIISTNVGGIPEIVKNKVNGLLISPGNLDQIEKALNYFLENPELIKEYGAVSEQIVQKYLPHSVLKELEDIYISVLSNEKEFPEKY
jgi:glycosyltransferase involved in cell wall biosynthesis